MVPDIAPENENLPPLGRWLRAAREARGATLDEAARVTRIGKNYLQSLEEEQFDKLPNAAYVKGFVRLYASFLGLSGDEAVARYERQLAGPEPPREDQPAPPKQAATRLSSTSWGHWGIPAFLLTVILVIAMLPGEKREQQPVTQPVIVNKPAASIPVPRQERLSTAIKLPTEAAPLPAAVSPEALPPHEDGGQGVVLKLKVVQDSSLLMTIDGEAFQQYELKAGDLIEWKGERMFALELGNAAGVEAELNGVPLKSLGEAGKPARVVIRADGVHPE